MRTSRYFSLFWLLYCVCMASVALCGRYATPGDLWVSYGTAGGRGEAWKGRGSVRGAGAAPGCVAHPTEAPTRERTGRARRRERLFHAPTRPAVRPRATCPFSAPSLTRSPSASASAFYLTPFLNVRDLLSNGRPICCSSDCEILATTARGTMRARFASSD